MGMAPRGATANHTVPVRQTKLVPPLIVTGLELGRAIAGIYWEW